MICSVSGSVLSIKCNDVLHFSMQGLEKLYFECSTGTIFYLLLVLSLWVFLFVFVFFCFFLFFLGGVGGGSSLCD